jgi:hypothetical protein
MNSLFGNVVYAYTRANAIADGELVDVSDSAKQAGFRLPVAVTRSVWELYVYWAEADNDKQVYQDESGRLWDIVWMLRVALNGFRDKSSMQYRLYVIHRDGRSRRPKLTTLKAAIDCGDEGEPVITVMLPNED